MELHVRRYEADESLAGETHGTALGDQIWRIDALEPDDGLWEFAAGDVVRCRQERVNGTWVQCAVELSPRYLFLRQAEAAARTGIGDIAEALTAGRLSWITGAQTIRNLAQHIPADERTPALATFFAIADETDDVSQIIQAVSEFGSDGRFDTMIARAEDWTRQEGEAACQELLRLYASR
jgi:hypothetical protein